MMASDVPFPVPPRQVGGQGGFRAIHRFFLEKHHEAPGRFLTGVLGAARPEKSNSVRCEVPPGMRRIDAAAYAGDCDG